MILELWSIKNKQGQTVQRSGSFARKNKQINTKKQTERQTERQAKRQAERQTER